jgi:hypothetical protein
MALLDMDAKVIIRAQPSIIFVRNLSALHQSSFLIPKVLGSSLPLFSSHLLAFWQCRLRQGWCF